MQCMKKTVQALECKVEELENYSRRDNIIISGDVPLVREHEDCVAVALDTLNSKLNLTQQMVPNDISVAHRVGAKPITGPAQYNRKVVSTKL